MGIFYSYDYSGVQPISTTIDGTSKTTMIDGIKAALVTAGWSATGSTGDWYLTSGAGCPGSFQVRVRIWGATNCVQFSFYSLDGESPTWNLSAGPTGYLYPTTNAIWRMRACAYQFTVYQEFIAAHVARAFVLCTVPFTPETLRTGLTPAIASRVGLLTGYAGTDTDTSTSRYGFQTDLVSPSANNQVIVGSYSKHTTSVNPPQSGLLYQWYNDSFRWFGEACLTQLPLLYYRDTASAMRTCLGWLWDSFIITKALNYTKLQYDDRFWSQLSVPGIPYAGAHLMMLEP